MSGFELEDRGSSPCRRNREKKDMFPLPSAELRAVPAVPFKNPNNDVQCGERLGKEL
jgi:hypothetical protein